MFHHRVATVRSQRALCCSHRFFQIPRSKIADNAHWMRLFLTYRNPLTFKLCHVRMWLAMTKVSVYECAHIELYRNMSQKVTEYN